MLHADISTTADMRVHNVVQNNIFVAYSKYTCILIMGFNKLL